jgi:signal transduction histidine kinase
MRGESIVMADLSRECIEECAPTDRSRRIARRLGLRSLICLPLIARGETIGSATFAMTASGRRYADPDVSLATDFAARISTVVDSVNLLLELRETAEDLRHANAAKDEFLGLVSHELKTPITTIQGNADVLRRLFDSLDSESRNEALDDIYVNAGRLQRLIDNMLVLARLERGHQMDLEPVILPRIVARVVGEQRRQRPERPIRLRSADADAMVFASPDYVEQVMNNLISNADKYSPGGAPIEVTVKRSNGEVSVDVLDRGAGIPPEESDLIFEPFYRSRRTAAKAEGIGVGLAVCKRVIEAQHGRLWARARPGGGSDFGFALPSVSTSVGAE